MKSLSYMAGLKTKAHQNWQILPRNYFILQNCEVSYTFYPNLPIFLHRYICHICDISQPCLFLTHIEELTVFAFSDNLSAENSKFSADSRHRGNHLYGCMPQTFLNGDIGYLFFLILLNQGKTKEDKEYCKQDQLEGGSQASNEEVSKPGRVSSENNRKAAKSLAGDSQDINHGWDATVCVYLSAATNCKYFSAMVCYVVYQTLP